MTNLSSPVPNFVEPPPPVPPDTRDGKSYLPGTAIEVLEGLSTALAPIAFLRPDTANPRALVNVEALETSIRTFGMRWPVVVNRRTGVIEAGHQRVEALRRLGAQHVPVVWADDDQATARAFMVADNRVGEVVAEWDEEALGALLVELGGQSEALLESLGFDDAELTRLMVGDGDGTDGEPPAPRDDMREQLQAQWGTKPGDIWGVGPHRIICGDSTDPEVLRRLMGARRARMIFTDPPYNVAYGSTMKDKLRGTQRAIENDDLGTEFRPFLLAAFRSMLPICDGAVYCCMSSSELDVLESAFREAGGHWSTFIIWAKNTFTMGRADYQRQYEPILYGWRDGAPDRYWCGDRDQGDVWAFDKPTASPFHPCLLAESLVFTDRGWVRIDAVQKGDRVLTAEGEFCPISAVSSHQHSGNIYRIRIDAPVPSVDATGNHPFLVVRGDVVAWIRADLIIPGDLIATPLTFIGNDGDMNACQEMRIEEPIHLGGVESPTRDTTASCMEADSACTMMSCGSAKTDLFRLDSVCITSMATSKITRFETSNLSMPLHTSGFTLVANCEMESGGNDAKPAGYSNQSIRTTGISAEKDGQRDMDARNATLPMLSQFVLRSVESVEKIPHEGEVWNLTVAGSPTFQTSIGMSHNTTKPIALVERAIRNSSQPMDVVMDPFLGSGTTILAAHATNRVCFGCELDPGYVAVILERCKEALGVEPVRVEGAA